MIISSEKLAEPLQGSTLEPSRNIKSSSAVVPEIMISSSENSQMVVDIAENPDGDGADPSPELSRSKSNTYICFSIVDKKTIEKQMYVLLLLRTLELLITSFFIDIFFFPFCYSSRNTSWDAAITAVDNAIAGSSNSKNHKDQNSNNMIIMSDDSDEQLTNNQRPFPKKTWFQRSKERQTWV